MRASHYGEAKHPDILNSSGFGGPGTEVEVSVPVGRGKARVAEAEAQLHARYKLYMGAQMLANCPIFNCKDG